jgi:HNH endonuclease
LTLNGTRQRFSGPSQRFQCALDTLRILVVSGIRLHPEQILEVDCLALRLQLFRALRFRARTANLPQTTEAERLVIQRVGQDVFREALLDYWGGRCPLTGITEPALLRASHIRPWAGCTDEQRLDVHNGLLLSALWDAAFDRGLISFADDALHLPEVF